MGLPGTGPAPRLRGVRRPGRAGELTRSALDHRGWRACRGFAARLSSGDTWSLPVTRHRVVASSRRTCESFRWRNTSEADRQLEPARSRSTSRDGTGITYRSAATGAAPRDRRGAADASRRVSDRLASAAAALCRPAARPAAARRRDASFRRRAQCTARHLAGRCMPRRRQAPPVGRCYACMRGHGSAPVSSLRAHHAGQTSIFPLPGLGGDELRGPGCVRRSIEPVLVAGRSAFAGGNAR
jgi:hypothetical protein